MYISSVWVRLKLVLKYAITNLAHRHLAHYHQIITVRDSFIALNKLASFIFCSKCHYTMYSNPTLHYYQRMHISGTDVVSFKHIDSKFRLTFPLTIIHDQCTNGVLTAGASGDGHSARCLLTNIIWTRASRQDFHI